MPQVTIRNVDDDVVVELKRRAAARRRSLEAECREVLAAAVGKPDPVAVAAADVALERFVERMREEGRL